jgi:hypothetical protein
MKEKSFKIYAAYQDKIVHTGRGVERKEDDLNDPSVKERNIMLIT